MVKPPEPAKRLRLAREARGLSQRQVADATRLSVRAIDAVEMGRLSELPAGIYRRSIVRAIAREVGLDANQTLNDYTSAHPVELRAPELPRAVEPVDPRGRAMGRLLTVAGAAVPVLAGVCYLAWPMPGRSVGSQGAPRAHASRWSEAIPAGGLGSDVETPAGPVTVRLTISAPCLLVAVVDGREVLHRAMAPGESVPIELRDDLVLSGDDAAAVQFSINGQAGRQLGAQGERFSVSIRRDDYESALARY